MPFQALTCRPEGSQPAQAPQISSLPEPGFVLQKSKHGVSVTASSESQELTGIGKWGSLAGWGNGGHLLGEEMSTLAEWGSEGGTCWVGEWCALAG